nr:acyltransferase family protein [Pseudoruegeria sp. SK021]
MRVFCMIFGVYYHAVAFGEYGLFEDIIRLSTVFRMEAFFLVSGFFAALVAKKRTTSVFLKHRARSLLIPFCATLVLINPITIYLTLGFYNNLAFSSYSLGDAYTNLMSNRHGGPELHLWFLLVLMVYIILFIVFRPSVKSLAAWCDDNTNSPFIAPVAFAFLYASYMALFNFSTRAISYPRLVFPFVEDLPYFIVGALAAYSGTVLARTGKISLPLLAIGGFGFALSLFYRGPGWGTAWVFGRGLLSVCLVVILIWLFRTFFDRQTSLSRLMTNSIYTVYLFHPVFLISIVSVFGIRANDLGLVALLILATVVVALSVVFHIRVIQRIPALSFLFAGNFARLPVPTGDQ